MLPADRQNDIEMKQRRIILSVTNDLVTDQRVHRSCTALSEAGYDVTLVGRRLPDSVPVERPYKTVRMRLLFRKKAVFYAEYNLRLFLRLLFSPTDAFYANDTDSLPANYLAAVLRRKPLFFDAHEMFPEVPELVGRPRVKRFWTRIEDRIFPRLCRPHRAAVTVCQSIADIYRNRYGLNMRVVRNVPMSFPKYNDAASQILASLPQDKRILLYQGAVNVGRGIEWIMAAMPYLPECHLVIAGVASLGLSLLENRGLNYYYSLPNRIADFVQSEVPVLATDFPEIRRVVETYGIGTLVEPAPFDVATQHSTPPDPQRMAQIIRDTLAEWDTLNPDERHHRFALAAADLTWENDKKTLLSQVDTIF